MRPHHLTVARTARYWTLGTLTPATRQVWLVCHGYSQLARAFLSSFADLDDGSRLIVAPEGLSRFYLSGTHGEIGASWMTREDRDAEIADQFAWLDGLHAEIFRHDNPARVETVALGFSQGVATAARWAARADPGPNRLILWAEQLPPEFNAPDNLGRLADLDIDVVCGLRDRFIPSSSVDAHAERLRNLGLSFRDVRFDGGHRLDRTTLLELAGKRQSG